MWRIGPTDGCISWVAGPMKRFYTRPSQQASFFLQLNQRNQLFHNASRFSFFSLFHPLPLILILLHHKKSGRRLTWGAAQSDRLRWKKEGTVLQLISFSWLPAFRIFFKKRHQLFRVCFEIILCCCWPLRQRPDFLQGAARMRSHTRGRCWSLSVCVAGEEVPALLR